MSTSTQILDMTQDMDVQHSSSFEVMDSSRANALKEKVHQLIQGILTTSKWAINTVSQATLWGAEKVVHYTAPLATAMTVASQSDGIIWKVSDWINLPWHIMNKIQSIQEQKRQAELLLQLTEKYNIKEAELQAIKENPDFLDRAYEFFQFAQDEINNPELWQDFEDIKELVNSVVDEKMDQMWFFGQVVENIQEATGETIAAWVIAWTLVNHLATLLKSTRIKDNDSLSDSIRKKLYKKIKSHLPNLLKEF